MSGQKVLNGIFRVFRIVTIMQQKGEEGKLVGCIRKMRRRFFCDKLVIRSRMTEIFGFSIQISLASKVTFSK